MANILKIKRRPVGHASGSAAPAALAWGELALNEVDDVLYYGKGDAGGGAATSIISIGGSGAFVKLTGTQTIAGDKTFSGVTALGTATATTVSSGDNSTNIATTAFVKAQAYVVGNSAITGATKTKITYDSKGLVTAGTDLTAGDIPTLTAAKISDFDTQVRTNRLDQLASPTASVSLNSQKITNLATPTDASDAATKGYVDAARAGLDVKDSVKAATTANISLTGAATIDGIVLADGQRVLVKDQTTASENGIYVVNTSGAWTRAADADVSAEVTPGMFTFVESGTIAGDSGWVLTTDGAITLGTTALTFVQFSGAGSIEAGAGLTKTGPTIDVGSTGLGALNVTANSINLTSIVTAGQHTKVTYDEFGRVTAGESPTTTAGYGITDAQPKDATLTALAGVTVAADKLIYATGADAFATTDLSSYGRSLIDDADASAARTTLGLGTLATQSGTFSGTSSGTNTGDQTTITGNAGTATALQTARNINGVAFDGTANITVTAAAGTLSGTALNSTVVTSSLTSVGTLTSLTMSGALDGATIDGGSF